jgi:putative ABC transport system permease protein
MSTLWQDFRYALRTLTRSPGFAAATVGTLALGIGANTAIFSVVHAVLIKPLPYERPQELVRIWGSYAQAGISLPRQNVSPLDAVDWRSRSHGLSSLALWTMRKATWTGGAEPMRVKVGLGSANFFETLGVRPALGSAWPADVETEGRNLYLLLTDGLWRRRFGADRAVVGSTLVLDGAPYTVVGVLPRNFRSPGPLGPREPELWRPIVMPRDPGARGLHFLMAVGRLKAGVSRASAASEMSGIADQLKREYPATNTAWGVLLEDLQRTAAGDQRPTLLVLAGGVGCLLAIACANIGGLLLYRGASRRHEFGIRRALGAGTSRLVRQLLAESIVLALAGGAAGILLALWLGQALQSVGVGAAGNASSPLDPAILLFAAAVSLVSGIAFGIGPSLAATRIEPLAAVKDASGTGAPHGARLRQILVAIEVGAAVLLLAVAGLFARSLHALLNEDPGFRPEGVVSFTAALPRERYDMPEKITNFHRQLEERLAALAGVTAVGAINELPLGGGYSCDTFALADRPAPAAGTEPCAENRVVAGDYDRAVRIPLKEGRSFTASDRSDAPPVAIVNETFARLAWPGRSALGQKVKWGDAAARSDWMTIVGVVGDVRHFGLGEPVRPEIDRPIAQAPLTAMSVVVRTEPAGRALLPALRETMASIDKDLPVDDVRWLDQIVGDSVARPSQRASLTGAFAAAALVLSALGVFGMVAFGVARSTREIGIRMALGAERRHILRRVVGRGLLPVSVGAALGLAAAAVAGRLVAGLLYKVPSKDLVVFLSTPALLVAVAAVAAYIPARRAAAVDPMTALRSE